MAPARKTWSRNLPGWWTSQDAKLIRTGCINAFVAAIEPIHDGRHGASHNKVTDWVKRRRLRSLVVAGICTDICVLDFVVTMLSARNVDLMPTLKDVVVLEPATATYDLPGEFVAELGLPGPQHTHKPRRTTWASMSWPRAVRCSLGSSPGPDRQRRRLSK